MTGTHTNTLSSLSNIQKEFGKYTAYANVGTSNERRLLKIKKMYFPKMKIVYVPYNEDIINKIVSDENAFTCLDFNYYTDCKQKNIPLKRHPAGDDYSETLGMLMPMNSDWDAVMKEYFKNKGGFTNSKEYKQILTRHLGTEAASLLLNKK
jgi:putative glutamine transport system substrate-binding protein